jgi:hypothetical protein
LKHVPSREPERPHAKNVLDFEGNADARSRAFNADQCRRDCESAVAAS